MLARDEPDLPEWQRAGDTGRSGASTSTIGPTRASSPRCSADEGTRVGELRTDELAEERRPWEFGEPTRTSDDELDSRRRRFAGRGGVEPEAVHAGQVTTISSSVRK